MYHQTLQTFKKLNKNYILKKHQIKKIEYIQQCFYDYSDQNLYEIWKNKAKFCKRSNKLNKNQKQEKQMDVDDKQSNKLVENENDKQLNQMDVDDKKSTKLNENETE